jgi:hypothetical protein
VTKKAKKQQKNTWPLVRQVFLDFQRVCHNRVWLERTAMPPRHSEPYS